MLLASTACVCSYVPPSFPRGTTSRLRSAAPHTQDSAADEDEDATSNKNDHGTEILPLPHAVCSDTRRPGSFDAFSPGSATGPKHHHPHEVALTSTTHHAQSTDSPHHHTHDAPTDSAHHTHSTDSSHHHIHDAPTGSAHHTHSTDSPHHHPHDAPTGSAHTHSTDTPHHHIHDAVHVHILDEVARVLSRREPPAATAQGTAEGTADIDEVARLLSESDELSMGMRRSHSRHSHVHHRSAYPDHTKSRMAAKQRVVSLNAEGRGGGGGGGEGQPNVSGFLTLTCRPQNPQPLTRLPTYPLATPLVALAMRRPRARLASLAPSHSLTPL